jgi:hypothetical protein
MLRSIRTLRAAVRRVAVRLRVPPRAAVTLIATSAFAAAASTKLVPGCARCLAEPNDDSNDNPVIPTIPKVEGAQKPSEMDSTSGITSLWNKIKRRIQSMRKHHKEKRQQENTEEDGMAGLLKSIKNELEEDDVPKRLPPIAAAEGNTRHNGPR